MRAVVILILFITGFYGYTQEVHINEDLKKKYGKFKKTQNTTRVKSGLVASSYGATRIGFIQYKNKTVKIENLRKKAAAAGADYFTYDGVFYTTEDKKRKRITDWYRTNQTYDYKGNLQSYTDVIEVEKYTKKKDVKYQSIILYRVIPEIQRESAKKNLYMNLIGWDWKDASTGEITKRVLQNFLNRGIDFNEIYKYKGNTKSFIELFLVRQIERHELYYTYSNTEQYPYPGREEDIEEINILIRTKVSLTKTLYSKLKSMIDKKIRTNSKFREKSYKDQYGKARVYHESVGDYIYLESIEGYINYLKKIDHLLSDFIIE